MNSTNLEQSAISAEYDVAENIVSFVINLSGFVLNLLCVFIFLKNDLHQKSRFDLFNYYLAVSMSSLAINAFNILGLFICDFLDNYLTLKLALLRAYLLLVSLFTLFTNLLELTASLIRYITINEAFMAIRKRLIDFRLIIGIHFLVGLMFAANRLFQADLVQIASVNQLTDVLEIRYNLSVPRQITLKWFSFAHSFLRDVVCTLLLFVLNVLMVIEFRKNVQLKRVVLGSRLLSSVARSQNDVTVMVILISTKNIFCHLPFFVNYLPFMAFVNTKKIFQIFILEFIQLSFCFNFFIYFNFNKRFRENFGINFANFVGRFKI